MMRQDRTGEDRMEISGTDIRKWYQILPTTNNQLPDAAVVQV